MIPSLLRDITPEGKEKTPGTLLEVARLSVQEIWRIRENMEQRDKAIWRREGYLQ